MRVRVKSWGRGSDPKYEVIVSTEGGMVSEDWLTQEEVDSLAVDFLEDTVLNGVTREGVVSRLIEVGVLDKELLVEYLEEDVAT